MHYGVIGAEHFLDSIGKNINLFEKNLYKKKKIF